MTDSVPVLIGMGATIVGAVGGCWGFYKAGFASSQKKNGYVKQEHCFANTKIIRDDMREIHEKVNRTNEGIARVEGYLKIRN